MPCFNAEPYLDAALASVLEQSYAPLEVIVVDDGSADRSVSVVDAFRERGVRLVRHLRRSAAATRNRALRESKGEYILFVDADDLIAPDHVHGLYSRVVAGCEYIVMGEWDRFQQSTVEAAFPHRRGYHDASGVDWLVEDWSEGRPMTQCGSFLIPRTLLERLGGWDERLSLIDDFEFFARLIVNSGGVRFAPGARLYYRSTIGSLSAQRSRTAAESACLSLRLGTSHLLSAEDSQRTRRAAANMLQTFDHDFYPSHPDLRRVMETRIQELGGSNLVPVGPPNFHRLRKLVGWRLARRVQHCHETLRAGLGSL